MRFSVAGAALRATSRRIYVVLFTALLAIASSAMLAPAANAIPSPAPLEITLDMNECGVMYLGTTGTCIVSLQTWMNWAEGDDSYVGGHTMIPITGVYDQATLGLVKRFQTEYMHVAHPNGRFGARSRDALRAWFDSHSRGSSKHVPCNPGNGWGCDPGAAVAGLNPHGAGVVAKILGCTVVGALTSGVAGPAGGVVCSVTLT